MWRDRVTHDVIYLSVSEESENRKRFQSDSCLLSVELPVSSIMSNSSNSLAGVV